MAVDGPFAAETLLRHVQPNALPPACAAAYSPNSVNKTPHLVAGDASAFRASPAIASTIPNQTSNLVDIQYDYHGVDGHRILRLRPTPEQWQDFPAILAQANRLHAHHDGCFKVVLPPGLHDALPQKPARKLPANAYKVRLQRRTTFWQVSTLPSQCSFASDPAADAFRHTPKDSSNETLESPDAALKHLKHLFRKNQKYQLPSVRYRVDVPAWTTTQRHLAGVPQQSPIHPLKGDLLDHTKAIIPGIHTPYVYESGPRFGATFQIHTEDFRLTSLNHLYKGRKIWIIIPPSAIDLAEKILGRADGACSQFMRHRAEFFFPDKLQKMGIPCRIVDQRPGETVVILPDAYHEGFSCGYTLAEAKNYADAGWTSDRYEPCRGSCQLDTAIPAAFLRPLGEGDRLDLCAAFGDGSSMSSLSTLPSLPLLPSLSSLSALSSVSGVDGEDQNEVLEEEVEDDDEVDGKDETYEGG
ncbi:hypothetical protein E4U61_002610 [Claviceps capensis]|nr:hypothetical protein E4U61_002610 [Claviceps capensis]